MASSLTGRQAPLGAHGSRPEQLRTETSGNDGAPSLRRQVVGNVNVERISVGNNGNVDPLVEGRDDTANRRPAPRNRNGVRRRNVHVGFSAATNDPSSRFQNIVQGYESLNGLTQAVTSMLYAPPPAPPRRVIDIVKDYGETVQLLEHVTSDAEQAFYRSALSRLELEMQDNGGETADDANGLGENGNNRG